MRHTGFFASFFWDLIGVKGRDMEIWLEAELMTDEGQNLKQRN